MAKLLIDLPYLVHRASYSKAQLSVYSPHLKRHISTESIAISIKTMVSLLNKLSQWVPITISDIFFCDEIHRSWRKDFFLGYKSNRPIRSKIELEDMRHSKNIIVSIFYLLGSKYFYEKGLESDDVIGSLANMLGGGKDRDERVYIFSTDSDFCQLIVNDHIRIVRKEKHEFAFFDIRNLREFKKSWNVTHGIEVLLYKSLVGDPGDNYNGVAGIGEKTFDKFLIALHSKFGYGPHLSAISKILTEKNSWHWIQEKIPDSNVPSKVFKDYESWLKSLKLAKLICSKNIGSRTPGYFDINTGHRVYPIAGDASLLDSILSSHMLVQAHKTLKKFHGSLPRTE